MVLRYISSRLLAGSKQQQQQQQAERTTSTKTIPEQADELLDIFLGLQQCNENSNDNQYTDQYEAAFEMIQQYPRDVIYACTDPMGNTILHLVLMMITFPERSNLWRSHNHSPDHDDDDDDSYDHNINMSMDSTAPLSMSLSMSLSEDDIILALEEETDTAAAASSSAQSRRWSSTRQRQYPSFDKQHDTVDYQTAQRRQQRKSKYQRDHFNHLKITALLLQIVKYIVEDPTVDQFNENQNDDEDDNDQVLYNNHHPKQNLIRQKSSSGALPLHVACQYCCCRSHYNEDGDYHDGSIEQQQQQQQLQQIELIQYLLQAYPFAVQCPDIDGNLPLHTVMLLPSSYNNKNNNVILSLPPFEVIVLLVQQFPESIRIPNIDGNLPLHLAIVASSLLSTKISTDDDVDDSLEISKHQRCPRTLQLQQEQGQRQLEIVQYLVGYWPDSIQVPNKDGKTPLHLRMDLNYDRNNSRNDLILEFLQSITNSSIAADNTPAAITKSSLISPEMTAAAVAARIATCSNNPFDDDDIIGAPPTTTSATTTLNPFDTDTTSTIESPSFSRNTFDVPNVVFPDILVPTTPTLAGDVNRSNHHTDHNDPTQYDDSTTGNDDAVVELAEDYFEVVVDRVDHDDEESFADNIHHDVNQIGQHSILLRNHPFHNQGDMYDPVSLSECIERFVLPIGQ